MFFLAGAVGHYYVSKLLEYRSELKASKDQELKELADQYNMEAVQKNLSTLKQGNETLIEKIDKLLDKHIPEAELADVSQKIEYSSKQCKTVTEILSALFHLIVLFLIYIFQLI